ncbi:MAG: choice-of-anchor tandem repeat GloVer-containing protein [Verrucomicrobiota bacterium]
MNVLHVLRWKAGLVVVTAVVVLAGRSAAQFPPPFDPCQVSYERFDLDGDFALDLDWSLTVCTWPVDPPSPEFPTTTTRDERFTPMGGTQFWKSTDTKRIPLGELVGGGAEGAFRIAAGFEPVRAENGDNWYAVTVQDVGGGQRHGWMQWPSALSGPARAEFARSTNQPIALGLPDSPRWLPRLDAGPKEFPPSPPDLNGGALLTLQGSESGFSFGVVALAAATNGTLFGIGLDRRDAPPFDFGFRWSATLFSVNADGGQFQRLNRLTTNETDQPEYSLTMTKLGRLFVAKANGPLLRFDPSTHGLARVQGYPGLRSPVHELSDGRLYSSTDTQLVAMDSNGGAARGMSLGNSGLRQFRAGLVEDIGGWIYLVAQTGGDGNAGGILRCRKDGTEASVFLPFSKLAGSPSDHLPSREALATLAKSPLCFASDGSLYGTLRGRFDNIVYRVTSEGVPSVVLYNQWSFGPSVVFTNGLGGFTWEGPYARGLVGGFTEGADGGLYGIAQPEAEGDYPMLMPAVMRIPVPNATLETLSQDSQILNWEPSSGAGYSQRAVSWVRGAEGILYAGTRQGIVSIFPGRNGVQPVYRTDAVGSFLNPIGPLLQDGQGGYLSVNPHGGAYREGLVASVNGDGTQGRILHSFSGGAGDVLRPSGFLALGDGNWIYGTSHRGDSYDFAPHLWRMRRDTGEIETLASLPGREDGRPALPYGLMRGRNGLLYGTTPYGGAADLGTLYRYDPAENRVTVLHEFGATDADRWQPWPELLEGADGWIYGLGTGENQGSGSADGWFRIAPDGSGYQVLGTIDRPAGSTLQITGGLAETSDHRFYWVRGLSSLSDTAAPVAGQILRAALPEGGAGSGRIEVIFENAVDKEPYVWPVGRLIATPSGELVGLGRSPETAVYSLNPATGKVRGVHRWGMRGTSPWFAIADRFAGAVLEPDGSLVVPVFGALVRIELSDTAVPQPIPDVHVSGRYGGFMPSKGSSSFFTQTFLLTGAGNLPAGIHFVGPANGFPYGRIDGQFLEAGILESEVYTTDGTWPAQIISNRVVFEIQQGPLKLKGPKAIWVTGEPTSLPAGTVEGLISQDASRVTIGWMLEAGPATHSGSYRLIPDIQDPEGRLRNYAVTVVEGSLLVVDREPHVVQDGGETYLEFPPLADHRFVVSEAPTLQGPWSPLLSVQGSTAGAKRFLIIPSAEGGDRYYRIEVTY